MALKLKKKKAASTTSATKDASFVLDAKALQKFLSQFKKTMGDADIIGLKFEDTLLFGTVATTKGKLILQESRVIQTGKGVFEFAIPVGAIDAALKGRTQLTLSNDGKSNYAVLSDKSYRAELNYSKPEKEVKISLDEGVTAKPLMAVIENAGSHLGMKGFLEPNPLDVNLRWTKKSVVVGQADPYHAVLIKGPLEGVEEAGELNLPQELFSSIGALGGEVGFKDNAVVVVAETAKAELAKVALSDNALTLDTMLSLQDRRAKGECTIDAVSFLNLVGNVADVTEWGSHLSITFTQKASNGELKISNSGRLGKVTGSIAVSDVKGKLPPKIGLNLQCIMDLANLLSEGKTRLYIDDTLVRFDPIQTDSKWKVTGFVSLTSDE